MAFSFGMNKTRKGGSDAVHLPRVGTRGSPLDPAPVMLFSLTTANTFSNGWPIPLKCCRKAMLKLKIVVKSIDHG